MVREAAARVADAANRTTEALNSGRVEQEPAFTDRMIGRIEQAMDGFQSRGVRWTAKTLTDRGRGAQEHRFGADFLGVLSISLNDYVLSKGFLAQAKLVEPDAVFPEREFQRLRSQCERMLDLSSDAFVFLYASRGVIVVPAISVFAATPCNPHDLYSRSVARFFEEHFESFIGDRRIGAPNIKALEGVHSDVGARRTLYLGLTELT